MFDAGALLFKIQSVGAQIFKRDMDQTERALEGVENAARKAAARSNELGDAQDNLGKKAKTAKQGLDEQGRASETLAQKTARLKKEQAEAARAAEKQAEAAKKLSAVLLTVGVATSAMVGVVIAKNTEFDAAMSNVRAATMATIAEQERLGEAALKAGADTAYSAREAAGAEEELAKAGLTVSQIVGGGLNGSLALAAAGQLQVARSAEIMATSLTQFKLPAEQAAHVADVLAAGAGKAQGGVEDMALALSYVGPVSAGLKISLEETAGAIAYMASQGILGEKAGTSLRGVLMALTAPSSIAAKTMGAYGIEIFDSAGNMKSLAEVSQILKDRLGGLTEAERSAALGRIFGNEQITAARVLYDGGAAAITKWTDAVNDSGYAADQAAIRQDNLAGDIEKLGGAFDTALIRTGSGANDVLREMTQIVTGLVDWYGELPDEVQATALVLGVATAAVTLFAGAAVFLRVKFVELKTQMDRANVSMRTTALVAGGAGVALTGVLAVVGVLAAAHADAKAKAQSYAEALEQGGDAATKAAREVAIANLQASESFLGWESDSAFDAAKKLGLSMDLVTDAAMGNKEAIEAVNAAMDLGANGSERQKKRLDETGLSLTDYAIASETVEDAIAAENDARDRAIELNKQEASAKDASTEASKTAAEAYLDEADATEELEGQLRELIDTMMEANGEQQDAVSSNAKWRDSLKGIKEEVQAQKDAYAEAHGSARGFKLSLDESTAAGSANAAMLADVAGAAQKAAEDQYKVDLATMSAEDAAAKYVDTLAGQRAEFEKNAIKAGFAKDEVKKLADRVFGLPDKKAIDILANTSAAITTIDQFVKRYGTLRGTITYRAVTGDGAVGGYKDGGHVKFYADGNENHQAQYARPGDWRVWAEPETGGEWYLPDSPAKRGRSLSLAKDMLDGWGYQITPKGAKAFASGGAMWSRSVRRGEAREAGMSGNGFQLVDEAFAVAEEVDKKRAERIRKEGVKAERQYKRLEKAADSAATRLDKARDSLSNLRDTVLSWANSVSSAIRRAFSVSDWTSGTRTTTTTRTVDGVKVTTQQQTDAPMTAKQIASNAKKKAADIKEFALALEKLRKKKFNPALVMEIANLGVEDGLPLARELLKATKAEVASINSSYASAEKWSDRAGIATAKSQIDPETKKTYDELIETAKKEVDEAKKNADRIERQLKTQTDRLIKIISDGYKNVKGHSTGGRVVGPGTSTSDSILRRLSAEEHVVNAAEVDGAGGHEAVERQRALWARGIRGIATTSDIARAGSLPATTANGHAPGGVNLTIAPTFINPIVKDPKEDAWKTGLILGGLTQNGNTL